nr:hypothetical protein [Flintibacter muris]
MSKKPGHETAHGRGRHHRHRHDPHPAAVGAVLRAAAYGLSHRLAHGLAERAADWRHHGEP